MTGDYKGLQGVTEGYKGLQGVIRGDMGIQGIKNKTKDEKTSTF